MKFRSIFIFFYLVAPIKIYCQHQLNVMVTIDDIITASYNVSDSYLELDNDTIFLNYEMGRFEILEKDFEKLKVKNNQKNTVLNFSYFTNCPKQSIKKYSLKLELNLFLQKYLLIRIYNFSSYPKVFSKDSGYGFEYISPLKSEFLPKRKKIKEMNVCD